MDAFIDLVARRMATGISRRGFVGLVGAAAAVLLAGGPTAAEAKKKKNIGRGGFCRRPANGVRAEGDGCRQNDTCHNDDDCGHGRFGLICLAGDEEFKTCQCAEPGFRQCRTTLLCVADVASC